MSVKQDRSYARTPQDIERKYSFRKSFAETHGLIDDNRNKVNAVESDLLGKITEQATSLKKDAEKIAESAAVDVKAELEGTIDGINETIDELRNLIEENAGTGEGASGQSGTFAPILSWNPAEGYEEYGDRATGTGTYYKVGNIVHVSVHISGIAWNGGETNLKFTGLPFAAANGNATAVFLNTYEDSDGNVYDGSFYGSGIVRTMKDSADMLLYKLNHDYATTVDKITSLLSSNIFEFSFDLTYLAKEDGGDEV